MPYEGRPNVVGILKEPEADVHSCSTDILMLFLKGVMKTGLMDAGPGD